MAPTKPQIPFPGPTRPYKEAEQIFFFGRDREVLEIKNRLRKHKIVVLTSLPRAGKTSLLRCGLAPELRIKGFPAKAGPNWKVVFIRPHLQPFRSLAAAISQYEVLYDRKIAPSFQEELESRLQSNKNTLTDLYLQSDYARKFNYLLVVDPVDELQKGRISDLEKRLFIDVLLRAARHPEANFYLVFSVSNKLLNSEDLYPEMREIVDANAYFLNTLSQVDLEQAIRRPIESFGYQIEEELCNLLIDKLSFDAEQLPKLQQALQGTWMAWEKDGMNGPLSKKHYSKGTGSKEIHARVKGEDKPEPGQEKLVLNKEKGAQKLTIGSAEPAEKSPLLQKIQAKKGTAKSTPSSEDDRQPEEVADAIFFALTPQEQQQAIRIFKSLAFIQPGEDDPKLRSLELESLADILGTDLKTTAQIASRFDKGPFTFIQVSGRDETPDAVVSIGELDILQNWDRLQQWMMEEQQDLAIYREIVQFAERFFIEDDREALWEGEILEDALNWRDRKHLNEHWAALYESQNNFPLAMQFLKESYENSQLSRSDTLKSTPEPEPEPTPPKAGPPPPPPPPQEEEEVVKRPKIKIKPRK